MCLVEICPPLLGRQPQSMPTNLPSKYVFYCNTQGWTYANLSLKSMCYVILPTQYHDTFSVTGCLTVVTTPSHQLVSLRHKPI